MTEIRALTDREWDVLEELVYMRYESSSKHIYEYGTAPLNFGGSNGSHHGRTATNLVRLGLVEHRKRGRLWGEAPTRYRGSKLYRATPAGREAVLKRRQEKKRD